ncbi:hypothetical protein PIB30_036779 [Stylosanthes scabra]|uniref:Putative plant transposon protein domain-containing protein n=1 Tax=Stylosanthes scabra TaxID=79078 RepID=A0ABU6WBM0_9FABA|nr:hypothetical protein [Stylosanthes scabra]
MASSSSVSVFDNYCFKTAFSEELYNTIVKNKKVIAECCVDLDEDEYPEVRDQIALRGWRRLTEPKQEISIDLIHKFYANAIITEEEMEEHGEHTYRSFVRGVPIDFSPENIRTVMRFRTQVQGATTDFETRKEHDQQLDRVLADLCMPGATWKLSTGQLRVPIQLRRQELNPIARGGMSSQYTHSYHPLTGVPLREFRRTKKIQVEKPITAKRMESTRLPRPVQHRQQDDEDEDHPMPQAEEGNEEGNEEGQGYKHDYHHQPDFEHQPEFYNQVRQEQREMAKEIQQVKNYQVNQTMVDSTRNKAILDELAAVKAMQEEFFSNHVNQYNMIRQEQKLLGKEILDVKKYQMSAVTMGSGSSSSPPPQRYEPDQALMKIREQHANFSEM